MPDTLPELPIVPKATLRRLGWPYLLDALAGRTRTALGRERALALAPLPHAEAVAAQMQRIEEVRAVHRLGESFPVGGVPDVRPHLALAEKQGILEGTALREVASVMRVASDCVHFLDRQAALLPTLRADHPEMGGLERFAKRIEAAIDPSGEVSDDASPALAEARAKVRRLHDRMRRTAEEMVHSQAWAERLQDTYFTVRGDRYVVPVKASFRYQVGGIVHNVSNTGQTVFIEPPALVEGGNELAMASADAAEEERRVLRDLTVSVQREAERIREDLSALGALDFLEAAAKLAGAMDASVPRLVGPEEPFALTDLRHPILMVQGKKVVPNEVRLEGEARCLVVSGPNAGGKTVTVTAVALCAVLARHGLPVPAAAESRLPLYRSVRAVAGDEQDLERDLSTFTAHLKELERLLRDAAPGTLLLVDEIAADTDPREGAALAVAVLEGLLEKQAHVLVTTHLEALKALAASDPRFLGAAVGFDMDRMAPTYRLRLKASAGSSALEVAARVGLPKEIVEHARVHLSGDTGTLARVLRDLETAQAEAAEEARRLKDAEKRLAEARDEVLLEKKALEDARHALKIEAQKELLAEIEQARKEVGELVAKLQAQPSMRPANEAVKHLDALAQKTRTDIAREEEDAEAPTDAPPAAVAPGVYVRVPSMGDREGEVLEVGAADALVALGSLKMRVALTDLVPLRRAPRTARPAKLGRSKKDRAEEARPAAPTQPDERIDVRGFRVDEGLMEVERRLDRLFAEGATRAVVVHGHGTGAMKQAVRDLLGRTPYVRDQRPGERHEGGDGVTVVELG